MAIKRESKPSRYAADVRGNSARVNFLRIDCKVALTFSGLALGTRDEEKKRRTTRTARRAYDTIIRLSEGVDFTKTEREELDANLHRLRRELRTLGQKF